MTESTAKTFGDNYQEQSKDADKEERCSTTSFSKKRGKPLLLGDIDGTVQNYLKVCDFIFIPMKIKDTI